MREERTVHLAEIPIGGNDGLVWNRLHGEREEICERLLKEPASSGRHILETRLRKVDDALDRVCPDRMATVPDVDVRSTARGSKWIRRSRIVVTAGNLSRALNRSSILSLP